ncbi:hypothetical protein AVDCRST_MAG84-3913 [uncultured Microcoleus sp.]|uniref:Uncharacterized protein n=1 Tax=uncultured Microcoleus sp. TaxID=259945 RepID=A0A6J4MU73_9CYAN|nr:hypothetical protein AVDCRST_MAG84-3913 [uncultured Microcoleus sp.]
MQFDVTRSVEMKGKNHYLFTNYHFPIPHSPLLLTNFQFPITIPQFPFRDN